MATETVRNLPAQFVEDLGKDLATQITAQTAVPVVTRGIGSLTQQTGETADQFKARQDAATQFGIRQDSLAGLAPQVAQQDVLQQAATRLGAQAAGIDPTTGQKTGLASFEPFLQSAQAQAGLASGLGTAALTGIGATQAQLAGIPTGAMTAAQTQQFMSPYQSQVIDATLQEFDRNKAIQEQSIRDQQAALGALGSGRAGVQLAEFGTGAARERALLQAGLLQQGFEQAQQARQQDIQNRFGLAQATQGLGQFRSGLGGQQAALGAQTGQIAGQNLARLGQLGALNQAQRQAELDAQREATRQAAFLPQEQLGNFADIATGIMGGMRGTGTVATNVPNPTPLQTALGIGTTLAGAYLGRG